MIFTNREIEILEGLIGYLRSNEDDVADALACDIRDFPELFDLMDTLVGGMKKMKKGFYQKED